MATLKCSGSGGIPGCISDAQIPEPELAWSGHETGDPSERAGPNPHIQESSQFKNTSRELEIIRLERGLDRNIFFFKAPKGVYTVVRIERTSRDWQCCYDGYKRGLRPKATWSWMSCVIEASTRLK